MGGKEFTRNGYVIRTIRNGASMINSLLAVDYNKWIT